MDQEKRLATRILKLYAYGFEIDSVDVRKVVLTFAERMQESITCQ